MTTLSLLLLQTLAACSGDDVKPTATDVPGGTDEPSAVDRDDDGYLSTEDCDDGASAVHPGASELCDGKDQDCDGVIDEDAVDARSFFVDSDGDGFGGDIVAATGCEAPEDLTAEGGDCDDQDAAIHPGAPEVCGGLVDADCDPETEAVASVGGVTHPSLQEALDAAADGDTVELCGGTLKVSNLNVEDKDITIRSADGDPSSATLDASNQGSVLRVRDGAVTLQGLTFTRAATSAVVTFGEAELTVKDCVFESNDGSNGGAIDAGDLTVTGSDFVGNHADSRGGAIHIASGSALTISDSLFLGNSAGADGGAIAGYPLAVTLSAVTLDGNSAGNLGGGVYLDGDGAYVDLIGASFTNNVAWTGGGWWSAGLSVSADPETVFDHNSASLDAGGAWFQNDGWAVSWIGGSFLWNYAPNFGGGIYALANVPALGSVEVAELYADSNTADYSGGGIYLVGEPITLRDSVTVNNVSDYGGGTSLNGAYDTPISLQRVEYRGNTGGHGGATDVWYALANFEDVTVEENVGTVAGGIYIVTDSLLSVLDCDFGEGATDNVPTDVTIDVFPDTVEYTGFGAAATFTCDPASLSCI